MTEPSFAFNLKKLYLGTSQNQLRIIDVSFNTNSSNPVVALVGESGVGKTTIYRSMFNAYIRQWSSSNVLKEFECNHRINGNVWDQNIIHSGHHKPNWSFATQSPYFFERRTVLENLFYPMKWIKGVINAESVKEEYMDLFSNNYFSVQAVKHRPIQELSGGQRQVINLARALLNRPEVAIIDECFSNMDKKMAEAYVSILKSQFPRTTFLITSHRDFDINAFSAETTTLEVRHETQGPFVTIKNS